MKVQHIEIGESRMVVLSEDDFNAIMEKAGVLPPMPAMTESGNYPATETCKAIIARKIVTRRIRVGMTQADLAHKAGVRFETISRLESAKQVPRRETIMRIDAALNRAGSTD